MDELTSNKRVSSPPASLDVYFKTTPPRSSNDVESVKNKKQKKEEDGELLLNDTSEVGELYVSPSYSGDHKCVCYERIQRLQAKVERLDERSIMMREEVRFIRQQTMEYFENSNRQHSARKTYMDNFFENAVTKNVDKLRTYFKAIVEEMTSANAGMMDGLKESWKKCVDSLKAIENKECLRTAALDKLIKEGDGKKSR